MKKLLLLAWVALVFLSCKQECAECPECPTPEVKEETTKPNMAEVIAKLKTDGFQIWDFVDPKTNDTIVMQQYYIAFLKTGPNREHSEEEAKKLQEAHLAHLTRMYDLGYADISGPFAEEGDIRGITIYNTPTKAMADSLANLDPSVKAGRLIIEIHPWWAAKGFPLR